MKAVYTPGEMQGKFITCSRVLSGRCEALACVTYISGVNSGKPVLYDSEDEARKDRYFNKDWDEVIPAEEYFSRTENIEKRVIEPTKSK